jgi:hypothetical protein
MSRGPSEPVLRKYVRLVPETVVRLHTSALDTISQIVIYIPMSRPDCGNNFDLDHPCNLVAKRIQY